MRKCTYTHFRMNERKWVFRRGPLNKKEQIENKKGGTHFKSTNSPEL